MSYFYDLNDFLISKTCSDNIYIKSGYSKTFKSMLGQEHLQQIEHIKSHEKYLLCPNTLEVRRKAPTDYIEKIELLCPSSSTVKERKNFYLKAISKPMYKGFVWPIDMVKTGALVFKIRIGREHKYHNFWEYTKENYRGFEEERSQRLISNFLLNLQNFYDNGYVYRYWDERYIYFGDKTSEVIFQFNNKISNKDSIIVLNKKEYYTELVDPFMYYNGGKYDFYSDMYSFQSLLFKLLIGIYPFEGEDMTGYERNGTQTELDGWIMEYLRNVYFIFDDKSKRNHIGVMGADVPRIKRWESLTPNLRKMFKDVFDRSNVLRESENIVFYTPQQWYQELQNFDFKLKEV